ncbi:unnamed protein product [Rotaria sp. Silwood1]|nr:unnamed protein product [Rotaria sp. Silwood1]CAF5010569.1 unnamed protein product [Rotaria sp. Silwood1]
MDEPDHNSNNSSIDTQENIFSQMMKQHITNGLTFQYGTNFEETSDVTNASSNVEHEQDENNDISMPIIYKKRARIKFSQEQLDALETTFEQHHYPTIDMIDHLVQQLDLPTQKITVWFQNRRARLKKNQLKLDNHQPLERDNQQRSYSGFHLDEDGSCASSTISPVNPYVNVPVNNCISSSMSSSPCYFSNNHSTFHNSIWENFRYPYQSSIPSVDNLPYNIGNYNCPFVFQNMNYYQHQTEYYG